jgi:quercetin dioxygenase-like cupin family protein
MNKSSRRTVTMTIRETWTLTWADGTVRTVVYCASFGTITPPSGKEPMNPAVKAHIAQPGTGQELHAFGDVLSVMLGGEQTGGTLTVMFDVTPPGGGPPPHVHRQEDELFLVAEGRISYFIEGEWTEVGVGGVVYLPRGTVHCYRNVGTTPSRHWILTTPSGFERFFARCADEFANPGGPDMERIVAIHQDHGIELLPS